MSEQGSVSEQTDMQAKIIYVLYLAGYVVGITPLIGVIMAYIARPDANELLANHYTFQIRTFWIGLLYAAISLLLTLVVVGYLLLLAQAIWFIVRCVKGLLALSRQEKMDVETWLF